MLFEFCELDLNYFDCELGKAGVGSGFIAQERELVFDIDLSDYDDVRNCCKEGNVCKKDWPFMAAAIKVTSQLESEG